MTFEFNTYLAESYHSATQKARVLTEDWLEICIVRYVAHQYSPTLRRIDL